MVAIVERVALKDWQIKAKNGNCQKVEKGKSYTTTKEIKDGEVVLFNRFWVPIPIDVFASLDDTEKCPHCGKYFATTVD